MAPRNFTGTPTPGPSVEEIIARERMRVEAWRARSQQAVSTVPRIPMGIQSFLLGRPHPMMRTPSMQLRPPVLHTTTHPMSTLSRRPLPVALHTCSGSAAAPASSSSPASSSLALYSGHCSLAPSSSLAASSSIEVKPKVNLKRAAPPIHYTARGDKRLALQVARVPSMLDDAVATYRKEMRSAGDTSDDNVRTWRDFHLAVSWPRYGMPEDTPMIPLTPTKIMVIGAIFKRSGYRSTQGLPQRSQEVTHCGRASVGGSTHDRGAGV